MSIEYNEYGEPVNRLSYDGKSHKGQTYNKGNKNGSSNKGKKYNKRITADRDDRPHITRVAIHYNADNIATCCVVWNNNGDVLECDPDNLHKSVKGFLHKHTNNRRTDIYYKGENIAMSDVTFDKYIKEPYTIEHDMYR